MISDPVECEICATRPAKLVMVRRQREDICRTFVCKECGNELVRLYSGSGFNFDRIVERMEKPSECADSVAHSCRLCGTTLADIVVGGKPGCCLCYARFSEEIEQAVKAAQGSTYHVGKTFDR